MSDDGFNTLLKNYTAFTQRIDQHIAALEKRYPDGITCKKGCDNCCKSLSLFQVEAFGIAAAFKKMDILVQQRITKRIKTNPDECPLLLDHACALYQARPVICRTHGYPVTIEKNNRIEIDFCPENFKGTTGFEHADLLSLEKLNTTLSTISRHFAASIETNPPLPERINIADALFLI